MRPWNKWRRLVHLAVAGFAAVATNAGEPAALYAIGAVAFDYPLVHVEIAELRAFPNRHVNLGLAIARVGTRDDFDEAQLRAQVTFNLDAGAWTFDHRQMLTRGSETDLRLRARLRAARRGVFGRQSLSIRAYDELFVDLNGRGAFRNVFTLGLGTRLGKRGLVEFYHAWSDERFGTDTRYWLLVVAVQADP